MSTSPPTKQEFAVAETSCNITNNTNLLLLRDCPGPTTGTAQAATHSMAAAWRPGDVREGHTSSVPWLEQGLYFEVSVSQSGGLALGHLCYGDGSLLKLFS